MLTRPTTRLRPAGGRIMKTIAVIGSAGTNARAWTNAFLAASWRVRNLVRNPNKIAPRAHLTPVVFDFDDRRTTSRRSPTLTCWR